MCRALVMKRQGDRVEHVLPEDFFPTPILREIHAQRWKAVCDGDGDFGLLGLAVAGDGGPNPLRRVHRELGVLASGEIPRRTRQLVELVKPRHRVSVRLLHDHDIGLVRPHPRSQLLSGGHRQCRITVGIARPRLDLDEDDESPGLNDQIELTAGHTPVAAENDVTM